MTTPREGGGSSALGVLLFTVLSSDTAERPATARHDWAPRTALAPVLRRSLVNRRDERGYAHSYWAARLSLG